MTFMQFPAHFVWGVSTSAYQIDGAADTDGRGASIWDWFVQQPGRIEDRSSGAVATDHYHRYAEDIALMRELGNQVYRFSFSWPRVLPAGRGAVNQAGLDFYNRLIDGLLAAGITPYPTLYHWELPLALHGPTGWTVRDTAHAFAEFADTVGRAFGDRIDNWITHNEPWCASMLSHQLGIHAPGIQDWPTALITAHNILLSHGLAVQALRANQPTARIGAALNFEPAYPASADPADYDAARYYEGYFHRWFLDPLYGRHYPADMVDHYTRAGYLPDGLAFVQAGDMATIATPTDFLGINLYTRHYARARESVNQLPFPDHIRREDLTAMDWEIYPPALSDMLCRLHFEYKIPALYVTENGCSYLDAPDANGRVADQRRIDYLHKHIAAVYHAIQCGAPVQGYMQWSLLDNFEWSRGYNQRFGIVHVDYETLKRTPKDSYYWYQAVIAQNGLVSDQTGRAI